MRSLPGFAIMGALASLGISVIPIGPDQLDRVRRNPPPSEPRTNVFAPREIEYFDSGKPLSKRAQRRARGKARQC